MNIKKIRVGVGIALGIVAVYAIGGYGLSRLNYEREKEQLAPMLERVKITSSDMQPSGLIRVKFLPLNGQNLVTIYPMTAPRDIQVSDLWAEVRPNQSVRPGAIGKLILVKDADPFHKTAEFRFTPEQRPKT